MTSKLATMKSLSFEVSIKKQTRSQKDQIWNPSNTFHKYKLLDVYQRLRNTLRMDCKPNKDWKLKSILLTWCQELKMIWKVTLKINKTFLTQSLVYDGFSFDHFPSHLRIGVIAPAPQVFHGILESKKAHFQFCNKAQVAQKRDGSL